MTDYTALIKAGIQEGMGKAASSLGNEVFATAGASIGSAIGGAVGTAVVPGAGTAAGATLGAALGAQLAKHYGPQALEMAGEAAVKHVSLNQEQKSENTVDDLFSEHAEYTPAKKHASESTKEKSDESADAKAKTKIEHKETEKKRSGPGKP